LTKIETIRIHPQHAMTTASHTCLSIDRAMEYVGDMQGVMALLGTLQQSLQDDLPQLQARLDAGDLPGANRLLHQLKGFSPVFCVDHLVAEVVRVEGLSKGTDVQAVRTAYEHLGPQLHQLLTEVQGQLAARR
jgi:HPt (histidine-containing phosphotransfer) domain-containing protein